MTDKFVFIRFKIFFEIFYGDISHVEKRGGWGGIYYLSKTIDKKQLERKINKFMLDKCEII